MRHLSIVLVLGLVFAAGQASAQGQEKYITFSGFVIDGTTDEPLPGAYIINERAGRGTLTNERGFFVLNVFPGDSLMFSYLGFKKQYHIIPRDVSLNYSAVIELNIEATALKEVKVYPFRTEEEFKQALIEMDLPDARERAILAQNFSKESLERAMAVQGMGSVANYRYAMDQMLQQNLNARGNVTMNPFLNGFAWASFIKSVKDGSFSRDFKSDKGKYVPPKDAGSRDQIFRGGGN